MFLIQKHLACESSVLFIFMDLFVQVWNMSEEVECCRSGF